MGLILYFVFALAVGTFAGPIQEVTVAEKCARQCTVSRQFDYETGKTYEFTYETELRTAIQGASEDHAGVHLSAKVYMDFLSKCEMVLRLSDVKMTEHDPETSTMKPVTTYLISALENNPLTASFQDGNIEELCLSKPEDDKILNIKRGILSLIQNNMDDINKDQTVTERDVAGECETEYTSEDNGWYNKQIKKSKNILGCTGRQGSNTAIQGIPYQSNSDVQSLPLLKSTHVCQQEVIKTTGRLQSAMCSEQHSFAPFSRLGSGATTHNTQTLTFVKEYKSHSKPEDISVRAPIQFQHSSGNSAETSRKDMERKLMEICKTTNDGVTPETPKLFTSLVHTMKTMDIKDLVAIYQKIKGNEICSSNNFRVSKFFLDAIPMSGTIDSLKLMVQLLTSGEVTGVDADMWMTTLAFVQKPSIDMLAQVKPLLSMKTNQEKAMLSVSSLVHSICKNNPSCGNFIDVKKIISLLEHRIASSCKISDDNLQTSLLALRAIGNAGFGTGAIPTLVKCIQRRENPIEIRLSAIEAFRRIPCTVDKSRVLSVFTDTDEDSEVRISAYKTLMVCPSDDLISKIKVTLSNEEVNQVGSYVWSHLTNLMETADPHKQSIRAILEDETLQKEFDMDKRKFSRNYEKSLFIEKLNTGATAEGDLIWSSKSFIPRSAMVNLTVDLFGSAINLFEIGGRVEGLEYYLESYFGPNGYFSQKDVQEAVDETAVDVVRADKVKRIDKRNNQVMDELRGSLYMRVFGNELRYINFQGLDSMFSQKSFNFLDMMMKLTKENDYQYTQSAMFMDSSVIVPTSSGFPISLTINGTATVDIKASGKMDIMKLTSYPPTLDIHGIIRPSGAVVVSSIMGIDAMDTQVGIKMVSTLHSSTSVQGKVSLSEGTILNVEFDIPQEKQDIISVSSSFYTVHRHFEREQKMITENHQEYSACSGNNLAKITGLELCGELNFPNASLVENAPYFPLTGPVKAGLTLYKRDKKMSGYKFEARSTHTDDENIIRLAFSTPNSNTDRSFGIDLALNKVLGDFDASFDSPWKKADFKGTFVNERSNKGISGRMNWDGSVRFDIKANIQSASSGPGMVYTPNVQVTIPGINKVGFGGTIKYAPWKYIETDMSLSGLRATPIFVKSSIVNKAKLMSASASLQFSPKQVYSVDSSMQKTQFKKKIVFKPQLSIRTPTQELLAFGATFTNVYGTNVELDMVLDKIVEKPVMLKTNLITKAYKRGRLQKIVRVDFRSALVDIKLKNKFDNRNGKTFATDMDLTYVIRRIARDNLKLVTKFINLSSKSLTKARASMNFASKRNSGANFKLISNINHNKRHSEVEADIAYGSNFKDANKQISVSMSMDRAIKSWTDMSASVNGKLTVGSNFRITTKLDHAHQPKSLDSNVMLRLNKVAFASSLSLKDSSKELKNLFGQFELELPGKTIVVSQLIKENSPNDFTSTMNARFGRSKNSIITAWKRISSSAVTISSNINIGLVDPLRIDAEYTLGPELYKVGGSIQKASSKYSAIATSQMNMDDSIQIAADIEYPSRHIISNFEGTKLGKKYTGRADIRWNADRDDTQRITLNGNGQMTSVGNVEGSFTVQYPNRTFVVNLRNSLNNKYATHIDFQWESSKIVSFDSTFGEYVKSDSRQIISTIKLSSPFQTLKTLDVNFDHRIDSAMYQTKFDVEWNPKKSVSGTITVRRPLTLNSVDMVIIAKAPSLGYRNIQASLQHYITNGLSTTGKFVLNRQSVQVDLSLLNQGDDSTTDVKGQLDVKTSFRQLKTATVILSHNNNGRKMDTSALVKYNKKQVGLESSMRNKINGWNVASNGDITIRLPSDNIKASWGHRNSLSEMTTTSDITWDNKRIYVKFNGLQDLSLPTGTLSAALEIQTPLSVLQDVVFQLNHLHKQGQIDSTLKVTNNGNSLASIEGKYLRENGRITSRFTASNPLYDGTVSAMLNVDFADAPMTSRLELSLTPLQTLTIVGSYGRKSNGDMDTLLTLIVPNTPVIELSASRQKQQSSVNSVISIKYQEGKVIRLESLHRTGAVKQLKLKFTSPYTMEYSAEGVLQTSRNSIRANANIEAEPYFSRWSMSAGMDNSNGFSGNFRINTPYPEMSYSQISVLSEPVDGSRQSSVVVEYVPGSIIKLTSTHIFNSYKDMQISMELSTPFADLPYTSASFRHNGDLTSFSSYGEIEYVRGETLSAEAKFSTTNGIQSSISIKSPYTQDISGSVTHDGYINNFASHGELTWGKTVSADIKHEGSTQRFSSSAKLSFDNSVYAGSINFNVAPRITTDISIQTPLTYFENIRLSHSIEGRISKFLNHAEVSVSGYGTLSSDVKADFESKMSMTISVQTPVKEFRDMKAIFTQEGSLARFSAHAEFQNGPTNFAADIKWNTDPAINFEGTIRTPFREYRLARVSLTHEGTGNNFKLHTETQLNKVLSELDLICNIQKKYDIDLTIRNPYINTIKASIDHWGSWQKFQSKLNVRSGRNKLLSNIKFAIKPTFNVMVSIKSPFELLKNQQLSFKHAGSLNSFKCNMQYKCNGKTYVGDATYHNLNAFKAEMNIKGPVFRPINLAVSHDGRLANFKSSAAMSMGKKTIQVDANLNTINGVKGNVGIVTPFNGLETINAAISHAGERTDFKSHGEITFNRKTGQVDITFDATHDISATISIAAPFRGYNNIKSSFKHTGTISNFNTLAQYSVNGKSTEGQVAFQTNPTLTGSASIKSDYASIDNYDASFLHEGNLHKFSTNGEVSIGRKKSSANIAFDSTDGYEAKVGINSPFMPKTDIQIKHTAEQNVLNTNAFIAQNDVKQYSIQSDLSYKPLSGIVTIQTPFVGYESTEVSVHHDGPMDNFRSYVALQLFGEKYDGEIILATSPNTQATLTLRSPLFKDIETSMSNQGTPTNFISVFSYLYGSDSQLRIETTLNIDGPYSGDIKITSPMMKNVKASFNHDGDINDFKSEVQLTYAGQRTSALAVFKIIPDLETTVRFTSPLTKDIDIKLGHYGPWTNCKTNGAITYGGQSHFNANGRFNYDTELNGEVQISTSVPGLSQLSTKFSHEGDLSGFNCHGEMAVEDKSATGDIKYSPGEGSIAMSTPFMADIDGSYTYNPRQGSIKLSSPIMNDIQGSYNINDDLLNSESAAELSYGSSKLLRLQGNMNYPKSGEVSVETPLHGFRNARLALTRSGDIGGNAVFELNGVRHQADVTINTNRKLSASASVDSPLLPRLSSNIDFNGKLNNFRSHAEFLHDNDKHTIDTQYVMRNNIKGSLTIGSPLISDISVKFSTNADMTNLVSSADISYGSRTIFDIKSTTEYANRKAVTVDVVLPDNAFNVAISFDGVLSDCNGHAEATVNDKTIEGDASFSLHPLSASASLKSPYTAPLKSTINFDGTLRTFKGHGEFSFNNVKNEGDISFTFSPLRADISIKTPVKQVTATIAHDGTLRNFKSEAEIIIDGQKLDASVNFDIETTIAGSIKLTPPQSLSAFPISASYNIDGTVQNFRGHGEVVMNYKTHACEVSFAYDGTLRNFRTQSEIDINNQKIGGDIMFNIDTAIAGSATVTLPTSLSASPISASYNIHGHVQNFKGHGEFTFNNIISECDASFDLHPLRADISIKSPMKDVAMTFSHDGTLLNFRTQTELNVDDQEMEANVIFNIETAIEGSVKLTLPRSLTTSPISASYNLDGTVQNFKGHGEFTFNNMKSEGDASFALHPLRASLSIKTPMKDIAMSLSNDGILRNFRTTSEMSIGDQKMNAELVFNIATAMEGSATLNVPEMKPMKAFFKHSYPRGNMRSIMSVEYGRDTLASSELTFAANPLQAAVTITTPMDGYKTISALFSHNGQVLNFNNHAEINIEDQKTQADMSFNFGSKLEGKMSASSPFFTSAGVEFEFSGTATRYSSNAELTFGSDKYSMDASVDSTSGIDASATIMTPINGYKTITSRVTHTGQLPMINTFVQVKTGRRNILTGSAKIDNAAGINGKFSFQSIMTPTIQFGVQQKGNIADFNTNVEVRFNGQVTSASVGFKTYPAISGIMSLTSPFTSPLSGSFNLKTLNNMVTAHIEGSVDKTTLSSDASFEYGNAIGATVSIKTPFEGFEEMKGSVKLVPTFNGFASNANVEFAGKKIETEAKSSWRQAVTGSLSIKTPFEMLRRSTADFSFDGIFPNVQAEMNVMHAGKEYSFNGDIDNSRGKLTVTTPFVGFEDLSATFKSQGTFDNLQQEVRITYLTGKEVYASFQNTLTSDSLQTKAKLETPYTEDILFDLLFNGHTTDFSNALTISNGDENKITSTTKFKLAESSLNFDTSLLSILAGYSDEQKLTISYEGLLPSMKVSANARILGSYYSTDSSLQVEDGIIGSFNLKTPFANLRDIAFNFEHTGSSRRFSTKSELQYDTNKITGSLQYVKYGWRRLQTSLDVRTPFAGFESSKASYRHTASVDSFECDGDVSFMNKDFNGNILASMSPMSASISAATPFPGFEQIGADTKLSYDTGSLNAEASVQYIQDKAITLSTIMDINSAPNKASIKLTTPFRGYETTEISITNVGDIRNFQSTASIASSIVPAMRVQANLKYMSLTNLDGSISFTSQINNFENLRLAVKNEVLRGKYNSNMKASWAPSKTITVDGTFTDNKFSMSADVALSTPFKWVRQLNIKSETENRGTLYTETFSAQFNGKRVADMELSTNIGDRKSVSLMMRSPVQLLIDLDGSVTSKYEATLAVSQDIRNSDKTFKLNGMYNPMTNEFFLKHACPFVGVMSLDGIFDRYNTKLNMIIDGKRYGYDMATTSTNGQIKFVLPSRTLKVSGSQVSGTTEGSFMWDADRDETKKIGFRSVLQPSKADMKADITLMMPSIGKEVQIDSQLSLNKGRILFDGKTELTYSRDTRKKFTIMSRLEDISNSWSSKNYSFTLGISHPYTSVDVQLSSQFGKSDEKLTGGLNMKYLTVKRDTKIFSANGAIDRVRKAFSFDMDTPMRNIEINGNAQVDSPYRLALTNKYDDNRPLNTIVSFDPTRRSIDFQMNYDPENYRSEFHIGAKYVNSSAIAAEMFHVVNRQRVTDALFTLRLNSSNLLHNRIHWRPNMITDLKELAQRKINSIERRLKHSADITSNSMKMELRQKVQMIGQSFVDELEPITDATLEQLESLVRMYKNNEYYIGDITNTVMELVNEAEKKLREVSEISEEYINTLSAKLEERLSKCLEYQRERIQAALIKLQGTSGYISSLTGGVYRIYADHAYNISMPMIKSVGDKYNNYVQYVSQMDTSPVSNMADRYTSTMYGARDVMNTGLASLMERNDVKYVKSISDRVYQQGNNAYTSWEIRENTEMIANAIAEWIREEVEKEFSDIKATVMNFMNSKATVYDPKNGEIQIDFHLPIPLKSLDLIPTIDFMPYITKAKLYVPTMTSIYLPSTDIKTWLPPFDAMATIQGNKISTFDGMTYDLDSSCTFMLARDYVNSSFSLVLNKDGNNKTIVIMNGGKFVKIFSNGKVTVNDMPVDLPAIFGDITVTSLDGHVSVGVAGHLNVDYYKDLDTYMIKLNGYDFGKTNGLLGSYDNEPSNDMMTSFGKVTSSAERFSKTWDIGTERCR